MTPSPYQAASSHSSLNPLASDRDARRSTPDWRGDDKAPAGAAPGPGTGLDLDRTPTGSQFGADVPSHLVQTVEEPEVPPMSEAAAKLAAELNLFTEVANALRRDLEPAKTFKQRCQQAFDIANDLFGNAPTWVCFYRELLGSRGMLNEIFTDESDHEAFHGSDQYQQIQGMLTALRSRDLPENDPIDPLRMITVRLPKSLHEAMVDEAARLNISINKLCISRMLQLLDPAMIPETTSKPRGRKPRTRAEETTATQPTSGSPAKADPTNMHAPAAVQYPAGSSQLPPPRWGQ